LFPEAVHTSCLDAAMLLSVYTRSEPTPSPHM
jgi:hypothetical protein